MLQRILTDASIPGLELRDDEFALYARVKKGHPIRRLMIVTHIDHPGIVLRDSKSGIAFGSVGYERIYHHLASAPIPLRVYDHTGAFQQPAQVERFRIKRGTPVVSIRAASPVQPNSHAIWDIPPFEQADGIIKMQNADNGAVTAVAIQLLLDSLNLDDIDIEVVFAYVEEVYQLASMGIAARGATPFGVIDSKTLVINLEAMEMETTAAEKAIISELALTRPSYAAGVLLKVNDGQLTYGLYFPEAANEAELLLKSVAEETGIRYQLTITTGSTDAKSFSLFPLTPHIITLVVPCKWKHNHGPGGEFTPEEVYEQDLHDTLTLLKAATQCGLVMEDRSSLTTQLKERRYGLSVADAKRLRRQRLQLLKAAHPRLRLGYFFDTRAREFVEFNFWRVASKFVR